MQVSVTQTKMQVSCISYKFNKTLFYVHYKYMFELWPSHGHWPETCFLTICAVKGCDHLSLKFELINLPRIWFKSRQATLSQLLFICQLLCVWITRDASSVSSFCWKELGTILEHDFQDPGSGVTGKHKFTIKWGLMWTPRPRLSLPFQ